VAVAVIRGGTGQTFWILGEGYEGVFTCGREETEGRRGGEEGEGEGGRW